MKRVILILVAVLLLLVIGGGLWFWNAMQQPLYEPGMVREGKNLGASLAPPAQSADKDFWMVGSDIKLFHFAVGTGTNATIYTYNSDKQLMHVDRPDGTSITVN